jgi:hypothetical protein
MTFDDPVFPLILQHYRHVEPLYRCNDGYSQNIYPKSKKKTLGSLPKKEAPQRPSIIDVFV